MRRTVVVKSKLFRVGLVVLPLLLFALAQLSCGGHSSTTPSTGATVPPPPNGALDLCNCTETEPASSDFRTSAKHVDLPQIPATDITVATMLNWQVPPQPASDAPRQGLELQMFHIANGF